MTEKVCPYCSNEMRPLDKHAHLIKSSEIVSKVSPDNSFKSTIIPLQEVTCVLVRTVIAKIEQTK